MNACQVLMIVVDADIAFLAGPTQGENREIVSVLRKFKWQWSILTYLLTYLFTELSPS
jgi:hypothetical protein